MTLKHRTTHHAAHWAQSKVTTAIALHCLRAMHFKSTQIELYFQVYKNISVLSCPTVMDSLWPCGFFDSTPRAVLFLPNPGHHPWSDDAVPFTSRWWCLQQYTYSRRIPLWNIQHEKCLCRYLYIASTLQKQSCVILAKHLVTKVVWLSQMQWEQHVSSSYIHPPKLHTTIPHFFKHMVKVLFTVYTWID